MPKFLKQCLKGAICYICSHFFNNRACNHVTMQHREPCFKELVQNGDYLKKNKKQNIMITSKLAKKNEISSPTQERRLGASQLRQLRCQKPAIMKARPSSKAVMFPQPLQFVYVRACVRARVCMRSYFHIRVCGYVVGV